MAVKAQLESAYTEYDTGMIGQGDKLLLRGPDEIALYSRVRRRLTEVLEPKSAPAKYLKPDRQPADHDVIEAPPSTGLVHVYLIDADDARRIAAHKMLSGGSNMVVRAYRNCDAFLAEADMLDEGCIILSDGMDYKPDAGNESRPVLDFIRHSRRSGRFACVLLTTEGQMQLAIDAMKAGAVDCLLTPCAPESILETLDDALNVVRATRALNDANAEARAHINRLTAREKDVLEGLLHGQSNKMIAISLGISPRTVEIYRAHLMEKLGTHSLSETLRIAFTAGMA